MCFMSFEQANAITYFRVGKQSKTYVNCNYFCFRKMAVSVPLEKEALKELRFLAIVNKHKGLTEEGNLLKWAIYRYCMTIQNFSYHFKIIYFTWALKTIVTYENHITKQDSTQIDSDQIKKNETRRFASLSLSAFNLGVPIRLEKGRSAFHEANGA